MWSRYLLREQVNRAIREFFQRKNFREIEVPLLAPSLPAEAYLEVFETTLLDRNRRQSRAFLATSPELFLKKLLVGGVGNCFSLCKSFRNTETLSKTHNPEFTILEWYEVDKDYTDVMKTTAELFCYVFTQIFPERNRRGTLKKEMSSPSSDKNFNLVYQGQTIDLTPPWERISMVEAFAKYAHVNLPHALTLEAMQKIAQVKKYQVKKEHAWEELFHQIYLNEVEPHLGKGRPTIIYDFPVQMAALAKKKESDPRFAERFEVYIAGLELGDGYSELTDWQEQESRFKQETEERKRLGKIDYPYDKDLIAALKVGLPRCSGLALGVDRAVMLFADAPRIQDVLLFPAEEMWNG